MKLPEARIAIIGLGYVGLPLAVEFSKKYPTIGFDTNSLRVQELQRGVDRTLEVETAELSAVTNLTYTTDVEDLGWANIFIVTVPTPIDKNKQPDLTLLELASETVGNAIKKRGVAVFESTVYPGATEDYCVPIIERISGLKFNKDFFVGYSPERINPGDGEHRLTNIVKVTSGSTPEAADFVDTLYASIIPAGTHKTPSIKVAEAAKLIENTQRDLNIALMNELAIIFNKLAIDTEDVLKAAGTKWNFLPFRPGLVGGHCIGVDPYYLTHKAEATGYYPQLILAGRGINDNMGAYVGGQLVKALHKRGIQVEGANVLVMGLTFKENCPDLRNSKVVGVIAELEDYNIIVDVYDPWISTEEAEREYGITPVTTPAQDKYDAILLAVAHRDFYDMGVGRIRSFGRKEHVLYDLKYVFPKESTDIRM